MIKVVNLYPKELLTRNRIASILNDARSTYSYARFNIKKGSLFLSIIYNRDNTIEISTNSRDIIIWNNIRALRNSYTQARLIDFVFLWINKLNT